MSKALIFDFDSSIVNIEGFYSVSLQKLLKDYFSIDISLEEITNIEGSQLDKLNKIIESRHLRLKFDTTAANNMLTELTNQLIENDLKKNKIKPLKNLVDFLEKTRYTHRKAIVSKNKEFIVTSVLRFLNIYDFFDSIITSEKVLDYKEMLSKAADELNVLSENCIVIQNSPAGVEKSLSSGMKCIAIKSKYPRSDLREANLVVDNYGQLIDAVFNKRTLSI